MLWRLEVIFQKQENTFFRKWLHLKKITMVKNKWNEKQNDKLSYNLQVRWLLIAYFAHCWDLISTKKIPTHLFTTLKILSVLKEHISLHSMRRKLVID